MQLPLMRSTNSVPKQATVSRILPRRVKPMQTIARSGRSGRYAGKSISMRPSTSRRGASLIVRAADYYQILGVSKDAVKKDIKASYRSLARKFHPDVNKEPGAEAKFKEVSEAYEVLLDDDKRRIYDTYGVEGLKNGGMGQGGAGFSNPFDIFETFFGQGQGMGGGMGGGGGQRSTATMGEDELVEIKISFMDAVFGCKKEVEISRLAGCDTCGSTGIRAGTSAETCGRCKGQGQVINVVRTPLGTFQQLTTCPVCNGSGKIFQPCNTCGGDGRVRRTKRLAPTVPAGVDNGTRLRVTGEGNVGRRGGPPGDLYVYISVGEHPEMRRDGMTIYSDIEVSYLDAILGTTMKVTTVDGPVELKIPAGTQPGTTLLLARRGAPSPTGRPTDRGNHLVKVKVLIPKKITSDERSLVESLRDMSLDTKIKIGPFTL